MCLLVVVSRVGDRAPLVVGANRDEQLDRRATSITVLRPTAPRILGGRDEVAGGTWLAVNEHAVVAALTNRPSPDGRDPTKRSRGELPLALALHTSAEQAVESFVERFKPVDYNPAWLLVGDRTSLFSVDMTGEAGPPVAQELPPGVHILENLPLGSDSPKVDHVRRLLGDVSHTGGDEVLLQRLSVVLADHSLPAGVSAQDAEHTDDEEGREPEQDRKRPTATLAACVHTETYGTRSSTLVSVRSDELSQISLRVADGPPCTAEFVDKTRLWEPVAS